VGGEQLVGLVRADRVETQLGETGGLQLTQPRRHDDRQPVGLDPPGREEQRVHGRAVDPLGVVDQAQDRLAVGQLGQQAKHPGRDQEPALPAGLVQAEGARQGVGLRGWQGGQQVQGRAQQGVQPGEGQPALGVDPVRPQHPHAVGPLGRVAEQRGLAHPRVAGHDQRVTGRVTGPLQERVDRRALLVAPVQPEVGHGA